MLKALDVGSFWGRRKSNKKKRDRCTYLHGRPHTMKVRLKCSLPNQVDRLLSGYSFMWSSIKIPLVKNRKFEQHFEVYLFIENQLLVNIVKK